MKVIYTGPYREGAVVYRGICFAGDPVEVSDDWYEANKGARIEVFTEEKPKRGRPKKVVSDGDDD